MSNKVRYQYHGEQMTVYQLADLPQCTVNKLTLQDRLNKGWGIEKALSTPVKVKKK